MTHKFSLILLLGLLLASPQLAAGGELRYPVLDSKFPAAEAKLGWIDNERVMFPDGSEERLVDDPASLQPARIVLRQELENERDRVGEVMRWPTPAVAKRREQRPFKRKSY